MCKHGKELFYYHGKYGGDQTSHSADWQGEKVGGIVVMSKI